MSKDLTRSMHAAGIKLPVGMLQFIYIMYKVREKR